MFNKEKNLESRGFNFIDFISQILFAILLTFAMLLLAPSDAPFMEKITRSPLVLLLNFIPIFLTGILFQGIFGRRRFALILNTLFYLIFFTVHRTKVIYRNAPFRVSDLALSFEALKMSQNSYKPDSTSIIIFIVSLIILIFLSRFFKSKKLRVRDRLMGILSIIISSVLLFNFVYSKDKIYNSLPLNGNVFNLIDHFNSKGFNYTFLFNLKKSFVRPPEGYDKKEMEKRERVDHGEDISVIKYNPRPNIIWIMGEAFTDLSQDEHFSFAPGNDPNENFKKLQKNSVMHGRIVTPSFGGGTGDTEFDALTGALTIDCAPDESFAFNAIKRDVSSLPSLFNTIGYKTMAFHPGFAWFYGRQDVYPKLGFKDNFFLENIDQPEMKGGYVSERQFSEIFRNRFLEALKNSDEPIFSYGLDIQNHGPYFYDKYGKNLPYQCTVSLSEEAANNFGSYFLGIKDMDIMLGEVYDMIMSLDEPTIMVFYGDHLPGLGNDPSAFDEIGIKLSHDDLEKEIEFYSTPYVILANESGRAFLNRENVEIQDGNAVSANYLASMVLDMLNYNKVDNFFIYNSELRKKLPIISRNFVFDGVNTYPRNEVKGEVKEAYEDYKKYEYYRINE
ncbi:MAG: LTA synthase family protein [Peptoniphilus grossensis]|uniref:LTA synthase family protein n=1 Tax=Peptoniphilus grossensis TaxID=1465756 RepID=UPI002583A1EF|nr:LTA synthase family protein [Peptoniphilus grossensis]MDU5100255.1 LTA synthase family protein [Peptoniphilus grossensis]